MVPGSQKYFKTAQEKLWIHPGRVGQEGTFEDELECWYANMLTTKCGGLPSQYHKRNKALVAKCTGIEADWLDVWKLYSKDEAQYYKKDFPTDPLDEGAQAFTSLGTEQQAIRQAYLDETVHETKLASTQERLWQEAFEDENDPKAPHYKQSMKTMLELNKKELLCMTLFVIDDDCGGHEYIRTES